MDKTAHSVIRRTFLIEGLPEPLTPASSHLQLFDNYIHNTRLRVRNIRIPETKEWRHILQQVSATGQGGILRFSEIYLNDEEYAVFERFEGREIRINRYFHEFDGREYTFDVYLGGLWGLTEAKLDFRSTEEAERYEPPPFAVFEVTSDEFFMGASLVDKKFEDVRARLAMAERDAVPPPISAQE